MQLSSRQVPLYAKLNRLNTNVKENCEEREEPEDSMNQMV